MIEHVGKSRRLKKALHIVYFIFLGLGVFLVARSFDLEALQGLALSIPILFASVLVGIVNRLWMVLVFLLALNKRPSSKKKIQIFFAALGVFGKTWMSRYFPVKGAWVVHRLALSRTLSVSKTQMTTSTALESLTQFFGMATVASVLVFARPETLGNLAWLILGLPLLAGLFLYMGSGHALTRAIGILSRLKGVNPGEFSTPPFPIFAQVAGAQVVTALFSGTATALIVISVAGPIDFADIMFVVGVTALTNLLSIFAFFAPAGIGVREGAYIVAFQTLVSFEVAVVIAVIARVWSLTVDLLFFVISQAPNYPRRIS